VSCVLLFRKSWHLKVKKMSFKKESGGRGGSLDRESQSVKVAE